MLLVAAAVVALMGLAPTADASSDSPWLCVANRDVDLGACFYDPLS
jgi:hypothetical protein